MFEWFEALKLSVGKDWDVIIELVGELANRFAALHQTLQPIALLAIILAFALVIFAINYVRLSTTAIFKEPFEPIIPPFGYPDRPISKSANEWFRYLILCRYISHCKPNGIGWFAPRIVIWTGLILVLGAFVLGGLHSLGINAIDDAKYGLICLTALLFALTHGYAHNAGRRLGVKKERISVTVFANAFVTPVTLTVALVAVALAKHHMSDLAWWMFQLVNA